MRIIVLRTACFVSIQTPNKLNIHIASGKGHDAVRSFFDKEGYETVCDSMNPKGFFHALGHGVPGNP